MSNMKNTNATPKKDTGSKNAGSVNAGSNGVSDYKYSPRVENPNPKATQNKSPSSGNVRGI